MRACPRGAQRTLRKAKREGAEAPQQGGAGRSREEGEEKGADTEGPWEPTEFPEEVMGWSQRSWARGIGVLTSLWPPSAPGCPPRCPRPGVRLRQHRLPAALPRQPSPAPPRRLEG